MRRNGAEAWENLTRVVDLILVESLYNVLTDWSHDYADYSTFLPKAIYEKTEILGDVIKPDERAQRFRTAISCILW